MRSRFSRLFSLLAFCLLAAAPAWANGTLREFIDLQVPTLEDGTRISVVAVERTILDACARSKFEARVTEPGVITARWQRRGHSFEIRIPYTDDSYSIRYKASERMDYDPATRRIDTAYNEFVAGLAEHIGASLDVALDRLDVALNRLRDAEKRPRKVTRINPRTAA